MKKCSTCKQELPDASFYLLGSGKHSNRCKSCNKIYRKEYYWKNKDRENILSKEWYTKNKEHKTRYYIDNIEHIKQYRIDNKDKKAEWDRAYRIAHRDEVNEKSRAWRKKMWIKDPEYMINMYEILRTYTQVLHKEFLLDNLLGDLDEWEL